MTQIPVRLGVIGIVDDDGPLRTALESVLRASGFQIDLYPSAEAFLDSTTRSNVQCLILDVRLPGMSGLALQRHLAETGDHLPIVFISAHGDDSIRQRVLAAGATAFLSKPVRSEVLLKHIRLALRPPTLTA